MARLKIESFAHSLDGRTFVYARFGAARHLLELSATSMNLSLVRTLPATNSEIFWASTGADGKPCVVIWKGETTVTVPLDPRGKSKSNKIKLLWRSQVSTAKPGLYSVTDGDYRVVRFDGAEWVDVREQDGWALYGSLKGAFQRPLSAGSWRPLVEQPFSPVHTSLAMTSSGSHWLIAASSGTFIGEAGATKVTKAAAGWGWCALGLDDSFLLSRNNKVWSVDLRGRETDTGIGCDDPPDQALFRCGSRAFYVTGSSLVYCYEQGAWHAHDFAKAGQKIGLG